MDWVKIKSFDSLYQAEMNKHLLNQAGIDAVVINAKDSMLLVGDVELYVRKQDKDKAENILLQFQGITKINSFILEKPVRLFQQFLENKGIRTILKRKEETEFVLDNYELYVSNEDLEKVKPYLLADQLDDWKLLEKCQRVRQTRFRVELLQDYGIDAMVVKKKDSDFHLLEIKIFVQQDNFDKAKQIIDSLPNWSKIAEFDKFEDAEMYEDILGQDGIRAIIKKNQKFYLYVPNQQQQNAIEIINAKRKFVVLKSYESLINAEADLNKLLEKGIRASLISKKDDVFLLGEHYLYVDETQFEQALKILNDK